MKLPMGVVLEKTMSRWQVRKWYQSLARSRERKFCPGVCTLPQVKSLGSADSVVEVGTGYAAEASVQTSELGIDIKQLDAILQPL